MIGKRHIEFSTLLISLNLLIEFNITTQNEYKLNLPSDYYNI